MFDFDKDGEQASLEGIHSVKTLFAFQQIAQEIMRFYVPRRKKEGLWL